MTARRVSQGVLVSVVLMVVSAALAGCQEEQLKAQVVDLQTRLRYAQAENKDLGNRAAQAEAEKAQLQNESKIAKDEAALAKADLAGLKSKPATRSPAPPPAASPAGVEKVFTLADPFTSGKAVLKKASAAELSRIAARIKRDYPTSTIRVEGHTDGDPIRKSGWKDNWQLSCERALTVVRQLIKAGVDPKNVYAAGFGKYRPVSANSGPAGKAGNRRVEIVVMAR
ncbi:MAG: OmpA family protein [Anaerolineaceae bacterium]|nr:OmpA family protein [Anaerolineaceae bacterium]